MSFLSALRAEPIAHSVVRGTVTVPLERVTEGLAFFDKIMTFRAGDVITVYDRACDHNGGRLISDRKGGSVAVCPLHGWRFDPQTGSYTNVQRQKTPLRFDRLSDGIAVELSESRPSFDLSGLEHELKIRFLNHACLIVECNGIKFATDPWLFGPAFCNGWWLQRPSPADCLAEVNSCDFIYVSHNHPDHMHEETLSRIRPDMPIVTAGFSTRSAEKMISEIGFTNVLAADFGKVYRRDEADFQFAVFKSGDFRDDSGFYFSFGAFSALLTVDANSLNFFQLPDVTLLASSFAGGATGFPYCWDTIAPEDIGRAVARNRASLKSSINTYLEKTRAKVFMPYAGYFIEDSVRDSFVAKHNKKLKPADYKDICHAQGSILVDPTETSVLTFRGKELVSAERHRGDDNVLPMDQRDAYYQATRAKFGALSFEDISEYFATAAFRDNILLFVSLASDDFVPIRTFSIDLRSLPAIVSEVFEPVDLREANRITGLKTEWIRVRSDIFAKVVRERLPWEDFSTGFQARFDRVPDVYNSDMWFHFTNVFIGNGKSRASRDCGGACTSIGMTIY